MFPSPRQDLPPVAGPDALVLSPGRSLIVVAAAAAVVSVPLGAAVGASAGGTRSLVIGLVGGAIVGSLLAWLLAVARRQRVIIDGGRIWVRLYRWRGPIRLDEVAGIHALTHPASACALVQPTTGRPVGRWTALATVGLVRRGPYRGSSVPLYYVVVPGWATRAVLAQLRVLLAGRHVFLDAGARRLMPSCGGAASDRLR